MKDLSWIDEDGDVEEASEGEASEGREVSGLNPELPDAALETGAAMTEYPEHIKMGVIVPISQEIGEFLDVGLAAQGLHLCEVVGMRYYPTGRAVRDILARYFEIDLDEIEREKRAMLEALRTSRLQADQPITKEQQ